VLDSCFQGKGGLLEQPEDFEDNHDNDNHSNYVKDISAHVGNSYQIARAMINIYLNLVCRGTFRITSTRARKQYRKRIHPQRRSPSFVDWARRVFQDDFKAFA
jgi:hypothetical protein